MDSAAAHDQIDTVAAGSTSSKEHHQPLKVASDHTLALEAGKSMRLQRNNTLCIDKLGEMRRDADMHVFSANYDIYALPKRQ
jgi:hypothetical protein